MLMHINLRFYVSDIILKCSKLHQIEINIWVPQNLPLFLPPSSPALILYTDTIPPAAIVL